MEKFPIKDWAEEDRPREKLILKGAPFLSDAELMAVLIFSGNKKESAVQLSQRVLNSVNNNLNRLGKLSVHDLTSQFKGIGIAKAISILAALELGKRRNVSESLKTTKVRCSHDAQLIFYPLLGDLPHEELWIALVNRAGKVLKKLRISQGGTNETTADLRLILKAAIESLASGIILCHNHPSGNVKPSPQDDALTQRLKQTAALIDTRLLDHIIIADKEYYSYADEGKI